MTPAQFLQRLQVKVSRHKLKMETLIAYSNPVPSCACCGEEDVRFLTIDHSRNDGKAHCPGTKRGGGGFYSRLRAAGFPKDWGLVVLCINCNLGRAFNGGVCPHKEPMPDYEAELKSERERYGIPPVNYRGDKRGGRPRLKLSG